MFCGQVDTHLDLVGVFKLGCVLVGQPHVGGIRACHSVLVFTAHFLIIVVGVKALLSLYVLKPWLHLNKAMLFVR